MDNNNMNFSHNNNNRAPVFTHQLPYGVRQHICNLCDADQSWRSLGGQFMRLDATQLRLVGQALLRNESPTGELLNKLDSANVRISELHGYLSAMGHCRATEILKPFVIAGRPTGAEGSLDTPTPSFNSIQPLGTIGLNSAEFRMIAPADYQDQNPDEWRFLEGGVQATDGGGSSIGVPRTCHTQQQQQQDPGDEIVRMACANNRKRTSISDQEVVNQLRLIMQITYNELKQASNDFAPSNILGNGGFASVYRGHWKGTDVAIKRLRCNLMDQALNELTILNSYRIDNILPIYGISIDGPEACLVYQFMANGSLEDRLSCKGATRPLSWQQRANIGEGVAKGLYYLHTLRDKPLVHGDAKSANVLLDSQFVPKLGDFGLARQVFRGKNPVQTEHCTHCTVSSIHGTSVYLPPEYLRHKILSPAVDVYSYGVVLLELATGRRAYDGKRLLVDLVEDELKVGQQQQLTGLKDQRLTGESQAELAICLELLRLGINCAHRIKKKRPDMGQVLAHFAQFKLTGGQPTSTPTSCQMESNGSSGGGVGGLMTSGLPPASSQAITRMLTPELLPALRELGYRQQVSDTSNLMSVDEEVDLLKQPHSNACRPAVTEPTADGQQIEAMIPLLTELGFSAHEAECTEANK